MAEKQMTPLTWEEFDARFRPYLRGILLDGYSSRDRNVSQMGMDQENMHRHISKVMKEMYAALVPKKDEPKPANGAAQTKVGAK